MNHPGMSQPDNSPHRALDTTPRPSELTKYDKMFLKMKAQTFWVYVVIERRNEKTTGGLYIPRAAKDMLARVIDVGPKVTEVDLKPGDLVIFKDGVQAIPMNYIQYVKDDYSFVHQNNIIGKLPEGEDVPRVFDTEK